jgi:hypothetical protein
MSASPLRYVNTTPSAKVLFKLPCRTALKSRILGTKALLVYSKGGRNELVASEYRTERLSRIRTVWPPFPAPVVESTLETPTE